VGKIRILTLGVLALFFTFEASSISNLRTINLKALIYKGQGSCIEDCSEAAAVVAQMAGLEPVYVSPEETNLEIFSDAAVWIQPGGESLEVADKMSLTLKQGIKDFISRGGGYVGFCAGAFFADNMIHGTKKIGLGIIPAVAKSYTQADPHGAMLEMIWNGKKRTIYWEEGAYIELDPGQKTFTPFTYYPTGEIAGVYGKFNNGRVAITGVHPEAPQYWRDDINGVDPDGLDYVLAADMVRWAAGYHRDFIRH
jgi:glutamine amidotransferase-like uncharacterized protein